MKCILSNEKLVSLNKKEANLLITGLVKIIQDGVWGGDTTRPLHPSDQKNEEDCKDLAQKMIDRLEDLLWDFEREDDKE
jgi:hypothetical protein